MAQFRYDGLTGEYDEVGDVLSSDLVEESWHCERCGEEIGKLEYFEGECPHCGATDADMPF